MLLILCSVLDQGIVRLEQQGAIQRESPYAYRMDECLHLARFLPHKALKNAENFARFAVVSLSQK